MNYLVNTLGRKGTLVLFVFSACSVIEVYLTGGLSDTMKELAVITLGIFSGANVFEHFAKKGKYHGTERRP